MKPTRELLKTYPVAFFYADGDIRISYPNGKVIYFNNIYEDWFPSHCTHTHLIQSTRPIYFTEVLK